MLPPFTWEPLDDWERQQNDDHILYIVVNILCATNTVRSNTDLFRAAKYLVDDGLAIVFLDKSKDLIEVLLMLPHRRF